MEKVTLPCVWCLLSVSCFVNLSGVHVVPDGNARILEGNANCLCDSESRGVPILLFFPSVHCQGTLLVSLRAFF